ncbi:Protein CBG05147 [Caenorhabditis briggsae]|uniref:Protein CBG05147 n=1 Tax=Caenorhabditis briggsae TaxID=6238 RepID=A8WZ60_CAEBR|nr:Protein CBG05147 [Caenorhabditis briggsae]CAP25670.2 Protein CBG05147 [Caenorhabditis briggsae]
MDQDDDAICLSDDDGDECIVIEESTVMKKEDEKICTSSYSLMESINNRPRSQPIRSKTWLDDEMSELDRLIQRKNTFSTAGDNFGEIDFGDFRATSSSAATSSEFAATSSSNSIRPEKRKLAEDEKETQKELKESAKRMRDAEKERKTAEKDHRKGEIQKKKEEKEREKEQRRIEREISAALNSKCEQYTYCHVGKTLKLVYADRKIADQLKIDTDLGTRIEWRRKCVELKEDEDGKNERFEYMQRAGFQNGRCTMLIVSFGKLEFQKKRIHRISLEIYAAHRAQFVQIDSIPELALFSAQYLRSLARREKKRMEQKTEDSGASGGSGAHKLQYLGEKGIVMGSRREIVSDWWSKMLSTIDRLSDSQRRAIIDLIPDPIEGIDKYSKMDYSEAIQEIGDVVAENGRRVGPIMAHRILTMLTDETGNSIVE